MKAMHKFLLAAIAALFMISAAHGQAVQKDYLTALEADKIRDAETPNERIKLFCNMRRSSKKFQYELEHPSASRHAECSTI